VRIPSQFAPAISLFLLYASCACSYAQQLRLGVIGGSSLTSFFHAANDTYPPDPNEPGPAFFFNVFESDPKLNFVFGPTAELSLPRGFALEVNALYRTTQTAQVLTYLYTDGTRQTATNNLGRAKTWEFPVLLKYALPMRGARPFVEIGPSFRVSKETLATEPSAYGITTGLGTELHWRKFQIAPSVRYTRWAHDGGYPLQSTNSDQVELLTSFSYSTEAATRAIGRRHVRIGLLVGTDLLAGFTLGEYANPQTESRQVAGGLGIEVPVRRRFSLEVDGIYRSLHSVIEFADSNFPFTVLTWQVPVLAKYRLTATRYAPFLEGGPSLRLSGNTNGYKPSRYGATVGAGIETHTGSVAFAPQIRFTRWATDANLNINNNLVPTRTAPNQLELLLAVSF
jgi:hypothetical protein